MEDNFYKMSSEKLFPKSNKTLDRLQAEKRAYEKEAPIISETIVRLKKQIEHYRSIDSVFVEDDPEKFMREVAVNKRIVAILIKEVERLERMVKIYGKDQ